MRAALLIAGKDLRQRLRDRSALLVALVVPLALASIFGLIFHNVTSGKVTFTFGVVDHPLIEHAMDTVRQHGVDMRHQRHIIGVIAPEFGKVVAESLAAREMLLIGGEAAAQWMAAGIDDLGVRQDEVNQPDMRPIVRHLVDEERPPELALDPGPLEKFAAQRAKFVRAQRSEDFGVARRLAAHLAARQPARDGDDVGQLHRAFNLAMRRQNLLDQRRAGARQADDEDRIGRRVPLVRARGEEVVREQRL